MNAAQRLRADAGQEAALAALLLRSPFAECSGSDCTFINFPTTPMENARNYGAIPFFSWSSASTPETGPQRP